MRDRRSKPEHIESVPNDKWRVGFIRAPKHCVVQGRDHIPANFHVTDPELPAYRACVHCGAVDYLPPKAFR